MADIIYEFTVKEKNSQKGETYTGLTYRTFKERYKEHKYIMEHSHERSSSRLAGYIWNLKDRGLNLTFIGGSWPQQLILTLLAENVICV